MRTAFISGVSGQDGAYLAHWLLKEGYEVHGGVRRSSHDPLPRLRELGVADEVVIHPLELSELTNIKRVLDGVAPDEVYNLAGQSFVGTSFDQPIYTCDINGMGALRLLECLREAGSSARYYQASTSEMFGNARQSPQSENTPLVPRSPYGIGKVFAHNATVNYREAHGLFSVSGILFNHESPLRGLEFVTRKITHGLAEVKNGKRSFIELGNLDAERDWGFAGDYVVGMWRMLQQPEPDDFVLATGVSTSVRRFVELAAEKLGMPIEWRGSERGEEGIAVATGQAVVRTNQAFERPAEVARLIGDPGKAERRLGWKRTVDLEHLVELMVEADHRRVHDSRSTG